MAKQRGVVQLSGRVDNLCYYQQKGVRGGLVRRVNLAMGDRVKVDPEYQNLRTANSYFGGCSMCAGAILKMTGTRASFLHKGARQAIFTKGIVEIQKRHYPSDFPTDISFDDLTAEHLPRAYDEIVKNKMSKYMPSVPVVIRGVIAGATAVVTIPESELNDFCLFNNCIGIRFLLTDECYIYSISRNADSQKFYYPTCGFSSGRQPYDWIIGDGEFEIHIKSYSDTSACRFAILIALPIVRDIEGRKLTKNTGSCARLIGMLD